jgi:glycosyltransferase involved in cell wall biosynthesis
MTLVAAESGRGPVRAAALHLDAGDGSPLPSPERTAVSARATTRHAHLRLLVVNFQMDERSPVLAWQQAVARELARRCAHVTVLTEHAGTYAPATNLDVRTVPRRFCRAPLRWLGAKWLPALPFAELARRGRFDACFVHMNHEWVARLWPFLAPCGVPIVLWYAHGTAGRRLRLSHRLADRVVTSSPEGFRLRSDKVAVIGQAIDVDLHRPLPPADRRDDVLSVGRIAPRKRVDLVVDAFAALRDLCPDRPFRLRLAGPVLPGDREYAGRLRAQVAAHGLEAHVEWLGALDARDLPALYRSAFVHLNVSRTGSMDKTVLEALACGCPVLTSNEAFRDPLRGRPDLLLADERPAEIARRMLDLHDRRGRDAGALRGLVVGRHDLHGWVDRVLAELGSLTEARCASSS